MPPCELNKFCALTTTESKAKIWCQKNAFKPLTLVASAALRSKVVVLFLLIYCLWRFVLVFVLVCITLSLSSFAIILTRTRELVALLILSFGCLVIVNVLPQLFLALPLVGLQFVIVVFPDHTHLLFDNNVIFFGNILICVLLSESVLGLYFLLPV